MDIGRRVGSWSGPTRTRVGQGGRAPDPDRSGEATGSRGNSWAPLSWHCVGCIYSKVVRTVVYIGNTDRPDTPPPIDGRPA